MLPPSSPAWGLLERSGGSACHLGQLLLAEHGPLACKNNRCLLNSLCQPTGMDSGLLLLPRVTKTFKHTVFTSVMNAPLSPPILPIDIEELFHRKSSEYSFQG